MNLKKLIAQKTTLLIIILIVNIAVFSVFLLLIFNNPKVVKNSLKITSSSDILSKSSRSVWSIPAPTDNKTIYTSIKTLQDAININSLTVGWLYVQGTTINLPILQKKEDTNNEYYLKANIYNKYAWKGWPFVDFRDTMSPIPKNLIIYGHNMGDGDLFGQLMKYKALSFLNSNPIIYFGTTSEQYSFKIFAAYITDVNFNYIQTDFKNDAEFTDFISKNKARTLFNTNVDVAASDTILTLSTCTYEFKDARFVVMARRVRADESTTVAPATINPKPHSAHN
jgi:SrtB family sortase